MGVLMLMTVFIVVPSCHRYHYQDYRRRGDSVFPYSHCNLWL